MHYGASIQWAIDHVWEIIGTVSGLIYLYLEVKEVVWLWPVGIITSGMYVVVFYDSKFYADMVLSIYYVIISIYGWYICGCMATQIPRSTRS